MHIFEKNIICIVHYWKTRQTGFKHCWDGLCILYILAIKCLDLHLRALRCLCEWLILRRLLAGPWPYRTMQRWVSDEQWEKLWADIQQIQHVCVKLNLVACIKMIWNPYVGVINMSCHRYCYYGTNQNYILTGPI